MCQQHANGDRLARCLLMFGRKRNELWQKCCKRCVERKLTAFMKKHGDRGCRHDLGERCQIEYGIRQYRSMRRHRR